MRRVLNGFYNGAGALSGLFLIGIAVTIIAQVAGRLFGVTIDSTETAGFLMAASTFFGLAYTLRQGGHIRVMLVIRFAGPRLRRWIEGWCLTISIIGIGYFVWWSADFVWFSFKFNELSPGLMAIPFWIPRLSMTLGALILLIALIDELVCLVATSAMPSYETNANAVLQNEEAAERG